MDITVSEDTILRLVTALEKLAVDYGKKAPPVGDDKPWLTVKDAAERIRCSIEFIYDMADQGRLIIYGRNKKRGRIPRFHLDEQLIKDWPRLDVMTERDIIDKLDRGMDDLKRLMPGVRRAMPAGKKVMRLEMPPRKK